ncbi:neutral zinc metallopeptidase [Nonomuraea ferruginea]|uniref:Neutral zinc metallopeptidase n=1 Tax=Nonomuraea ferruginea TaxID=46174 RepID=A0ABT4T172_9ACTN|nr:neutral zinc metallopeptidase [Nonomuraea ferruginea]MDA0643243.1 neutral zinc metallopeptidase [Nonomuraea ferruginea]
MRVRSAFLGLCVVAATAVPALPAHAAPYKDPFDGSGKLARVVCPEPAITYGGIPRTREYLATVVKCLDKSWKAHFAADRRPFRKPAVRFYDEPERRVCGVPWPESAAAFYCTNRRVLVFPLTGDWIENRTDLYPLKVAAHEYGHHLQSLTGARRHYEAGVKASPGRQAELGRRYELQADCLSGVFLGAVWGSLERTGDDWAALLDATRASGDDEHRRSHGAGATRVRWLKRGHHAVSPSACDTWSAPPSAVS